MSGDDGGDPAATDAFDRQARRYDAWYDSPLGSAVFQEEIDALRPLLAGLPRPWLEVGAGSGRFAAVLRTEVALDPAREPLRLAAHRGARAAVGRGEALPFRPSTFGAVMFVTSLCFIPDPVAALRESRRVLRPGGGIVLGLIPSEGQWGRHYRLLASQGNPYYQRAHFFDWPELGGLLAAAGLCVTRVRSALRRPPTADPVADQSIEGKDPTAGFAAVLAEPATP